LSAPRSPAVTPARRAGYEVLRRVFEHGAWADRALPAALRRHRIEGRERAQAQRLAYGAVQRRGTSDHFVRMLAERPADELDGHLLAALRLGLFELLYASATPDHAAVDQAVELAKGGGRRRGAGLVNAVLRRAARERDSLLAALGDATPAEAAVAHSHPTWLAEMWWEELGPDAARSLMAADNEPPETALRVNTLRADPDRLLADLVAADVEVSRRGPSGPAAPESLVVAGPLTEPVSAAIETGRLVPQSRASAAVVDALDPRPGERTLDLCAGPGVKTTQIAARMADEGEVLSVERDGRRCAEIDALCARLGVSCVQVVEGDARDDFGGGYDRVLVDPPCSDLGTLASRPDARWRKSGDQVARLATLQREIVGRAQTAVRPGGKLVYSTCTISGLENEAVASGARLEPDDLGASHRGLASPRDPRFVQTRPDRDRTDGFFVARFRAPRS
jgi:16S rRNA (cytosine967-C5)-methyltransferase